MHVQLDIVNILGQRIKTVLDEDLGPGRMFAPGMAVTTHPAGCHRNLLLSTKRQRSTGNPQDGPVEIVAVLAVLFTA